MRRTDDPAADFEAWDAAREQRLRSLPVCIECCEPIQDDFAFRLDQGWVCERCMEWFRREVMPTGSV